MAVRGDPRSPPRPGAAFLRNHMRNMAAVDMFVVATATFWLLYALIVLGPDRRRIIHFEVPKSNASLAGTPNDLDQAYFNQPPFRMAA